MSLQDDFGNNQDDESPTHKPICGAASRPQIIEMCMLWALIILIIPQIILEIHQDDLISKNTCAFFHNSSFSKKSTKMALTIMAEVTLNPIKSY